MNRDRECARDLSKRLEVKQEVSKILARDIIKLEKENDSLSKRLEKAQEEIARLRGALERIREWPYDIMGDCVYDARKEAEEALKEIL
jgi:predicted RNase H-like nuclease (RuvC/YqgF family)